MIARAGLSGAAIAVVLVGLMGSAGLATPSVPGSTTAHFSAHADGEAPSGVDAAFTARTSPAPSSCPAAAESPDLAVAARALASGVNPDEIYLPGPAATPCEVATAASQGHVTPQYESAPAPMGLGEYGLRSDAAGGVQPFILNTTSVRGTFDAAALGGPNATTLLNPAPDDYGVQLNAVVTNVTLFGRGGDSFWTQNVMLYSPYNHTLGFITNVWNWTNYAENLTSNAIYDHGPHGNLSGSGPYYAEVGLFSVSYPFNATLTMVSTLTDGRDAVYFSAVVTDRSGTINLPDYDYVVFNSLTNGSPPLTAPGQYQADGYAYNAIGHLDDFELTIGGPGGGTQTTFLSANATETLDYWNGTTGAYQSVPSAYSFGSETGETSMGASVSWATGPNGAPYAIMTTGPSLLGGLWNASSPAGGPGRLNVVVQPSNAFVFLGFGNGSAFNDSAAALAPTVDTHSFTLPSGVYSAALAESDYAPVLIANFTVRAGTTLTLVRNLTWDPSIGIYTPLWAWTNAQIGNLSTSGDGTMDHPYVIVNNQLSALSPTFGAVNDLGYLIYPGVYFLHTTAYTTFVNPPSFTAQTTEQFAPSVALPWWFYDDANIAITGAQNITGWFSGRSAAIHTWNVIVWNSTGFLIANDSFQTQAHGLLLYGGTDNVVWGNRFSQLEPPFSDPAPVPFSEGIALDVQESGDTIYNNLFLNNPTTAESPATDLYFGTPKVYTDTWNVSPQPASNVHYAANWPADPLTGSIIQTEVQGGNFWWDYGVWESPSGWSNPYGALPYDESGQIANGGDHAPLLYTPLYAIRLVPLGLPGSASWTVNVTSATNPLVVFASSTGSGPHTVNLTGAPIGTYAAVGSIGGSRFAAPVVTFDVTGSASVNVRFSSIYPVTFSEKGLPSGGIWSGIVNGTYKQGPTGTPLSWSVPNGTSFYEIFDYPGWQQSTLPYSGTVSVDGAPVVEPTLVFAPTEFDVTFNETGIASGEWTVSVNGTAYTEPVGTAIVASEPNGTYAYAIGNVPGYHQTTLPYSGTVHVQGRAHTEPTLVFTPVEYAVTFGETGLATGANWSVTVGTTIHYATVSTIVLELPNGSYTYGVVAVGAYYPQPSTPGAFTVVGANQSLAVTYVYTVALTFTESGLPSGASWTVNVTGKGGASWTSSSPASTITFHLPANATYTYSITAPSGYSVSAPSGTVALGGSGFTVPAVTIGATSAPAPSSSPWVWVVVTVVVVVAAAGIAFALYRRGRRPEPSAAEGSGEPTLRSTN